MWFKEWEPVGLLGRGGTAAVERVRHVDSGAIRAFKRAHAPDLSSVVLSEADALARVRHPAVPRLEASGVDAQGRAWLVRDVLEGVPLSAPEGLPARSVGITLDLLVQGMDLLVHLEQAGLVHGDLKPENLLIVDGDAEGEPPRLGVLDLSAESDMVTPGLATPERLAGAPASAADDWFALGVSFWLARYGEHPFPGYPGKLQPGARLARASLAPLDADDDVARALAPLIALEGARRLRDWRAIQRHLATVTGVDLRLPLDESLRFRLAHPVPLQRRREPLVEMERWLDAPGPAGVAWLEGEAGVGKGVLLSRLADRARRAGRIVRLIDLASPAATDGLRAAIQAARTGDDARAVVLVDHVDQAPASLQDELLAFVEERLIADPDHAAPPSVRFILCGRERPDRPIPCFALAPLSDAEARGLLEASFPGQQLQPREARAWIEAARGNPRRLMGLLQAARRAGQISWAGDAVSLGEAPEATLDAGAARSMGARLEATLTCDVAARQALADELGDDPSAALPRALLLDDAGGARVALTAILDAFDLDEDAPRLAWGVVPWTGALLAREALPGDLRPRLIDALLAVGEEGAARRLLDSGADGGQARELDLRRARLALRDGAWEAVDAWLERARPLERVEEHRLAARAAMLRARYADAEAHLAELERLGDRDATTRQLAATLAFYRSDYPEARQQLERLLSAADFHPAAEHLNLAGVVAEREGEFEQAERWYQRALERARACWDRSYLWKVAMNLGVLQQRRGERYIALDSYHRAWDFADATGNVEGRMKLALNLGNLLVALGHDDEAASFVDRATALAVELGDAFTGAYAEVLAGELARSRGDYARAVTAHAHALAYFEAEDNRIEALQTEVELGWSQWHAGEAEAATARLERVLIESAAFPAVQQKAARALAIVALAGPASRLRRVRLERALDVLEADDGAEACYVRARWAVERGALDEVGGAARALQAALEARFGALTPEDRARVQAREPWPAALALARLVTGAESTMHEHTRSRFQALIAMTSRLSSSEDPRALLDDLLDEAIRFAGAERGFVLLSEGARWRVFAARNIDQERIRHKEHKVSYGIASEVLEGGEPIVTVDAMSDQRFQEYLSIHKLKLRSVLCLPIRVSGDTGGVLYLDNRFAPSRFGDDELYGVRILADQVGIALTRHTLLLSLSEREDELRRSSEEIARLNEKLKAELDETSRRLAERERDLERLSVQHAFPGIVGASDALKRCLFMVERVKDADVPVLVQGESGTGKELIARAIHFEGARAAGPFVPVNCGAIPANLFESELFGHKKGSFTGASSDKTGLFESADGGTIFLDEVADLPQDMQVKLLRVLQSGDLQRIGETRTRRVDVRVLAALNRDLKTLVREGRFREDLYYRLNVVHIVVPPLRDRRDDIPLLVQNFLKKNQDEGFSPVTSISRAALRSLTEHAWPGNVRQLETVIKNASLFASTSELRPEDFSEISSFRSTEPDLEGLARGGLDRGYRLKDFELLLIRHTLELTGGNKKRTAELLGIDRRTLYNKLARM